MKYRFKIDYIPKDEMVQQLLKDKMIRKGEVVDVVGYSEPVGEVVCFYMKGIQVNIPLQSFLLITEEYYEPQERKTCPTCKHKQECIKRAKESGIILLGDFCARYEKATTENIYLSEEDKKEVCWKCRRFNDKSMNICQNYEEGMKCRIWFDDNGNRIDKDGSL